MMELNSSYLRKSQIFTATASNSFNQILTNIFSLEAQQRRLT